jgi:prepilin-type processing-associated H-X9-DG protein
MRAITMIEALVVLAVLGVIAALLLPHFRKARVRGHPIRCVNNLKQVGIAFRLFATDHQDRFPSQVSTNEGGSLELLDSAWLHFRPLSNELTNPKMLACPTEGEEWWTRCATNFASAKPGLVSYFVNPDADETEPHGILAGDRHLATNGVRLKPGLVTIHSNAIFHWTRDLHPVPLTNFTRGNVVFADGSAMQIYSPKLIGGFLQEAFLKPKRLILP